MSGLSGAAVMLGTGRWSSTAAAEPVRMAYPFTLGVASGDPRPNGFVLWTRLAPRPLDPDGHGGMGLRIVRVLYEVATDRRFRHIVRRGSAEATPGLGHSLHPEVYGLEPDRVYFYRFSVGGHLSPTGRTRTTPSNRANGLAFAFVSCQSWSAGYFTAYRHLAKDDLDLVVHLGDYIYEHGISSNPGGRTETAPDHVRYMATDLASYRLRYALTKVDADLQLAHRRFPWLLTLDDHEVANGWNSTDTAPKFLRRRAAAFQAWYEHLPLRVGQRPRGADMQIFRRLRYGDLATFHVLDTRQYRDAPACQRLSTDCDARFDPERTMMGAEQESWLLRGLEKSTARWDVLANQVTMGQNDRDAGDGQQLNMEMWDGYVASRDRVLRGAVRRGAADLVVITGDKHMNVALNLKDNYDDPASAATLGTELIGTSVTSGGDGEPQSPWARSLLAGNPHMAYVNSQRGYARCRVTRHSYETDFRVVDHVEGDRRGSVRTDATAVIEHGIPGLAAVVT